MSAVQLPEWIGPCLVCLLIFLDEYLHNICIMTWMDYNRIDGFIFSDVLATITDTFLFYFFCFSFAFHHLLCWSKFCHFLETGDRRPGYPRTRERIYNELSAILPPRASRWKCLVSRCSGLSLGLGTRLVTNLNVIATTCSIVNIITPRL